MNQTKKFDLRPFQDRLTPAKEKGRYICPICENNNLTINQKTGEFSCWRNKCDRSAILRAITPLERQEKSVRPRQNRTWEYTDAEGNPVIHVRRIDKGNGESKKIWQEYLVNGQWISGSKAPEDVKKAAKKAVVPYGYLEALGAVRKGAKQAFWVEGETCVDALRKLGIPAMTSLGGSGSYRKYGSYAKLFKDFPSELVICPDRDVCGVEYAQEVAKDLKINLWCKPYPDSPVWQNLPEKGGLDIADWIADGKTVADIQQAIAEAEVEQAPGADEEEEVSLGDLEQDKMDFGNFCQRAKAALYDNHDPDKPWVCVDGQLYQWQGTHYEASPDEVEYKRVFDYADNFVVYTGKPPNLTHTYPFAKPSQVEQAMTWIKMGLTVDPRRVNPAGLNCTNGILKINWNGDRPSVELVPHSPEHIFIYAPVVKYDPNADPTACDRLLSTLEPGQQDVFLKVAGASLDLATVRKFRGREVRALLMKGDGNNGKDTLRESLSAIYGYQGVTGCTLSDFQMYDEGRKFPLARLRDARVNWASENGNATKLDKLQSLKAFITGDNLDCEQKNVDVKEFTPKAIGVFNINDIPHLEAFQEAIKSRYAVISFDKTFKMGADPSKGEIEADPRFKYDHEFLKAEVLPAFLNKLVDALQRLMVEGIDYSCTDGALTEIQRLSSHLFQFAEDVGLTYGNPGDRLYAGQIWEQLEAWYLANGTLTLEVSDKGKEKKVWVEQSRGSDRNVKAPNQILPRILQLFPKAKRGTESSPKGVYITGLTLNQLNQFEAKPEAVSHSERDFEAVEPISTIAAQVEQLLAGLSPEQREQVLKQTGIGKIGSTASKPFPESDTASSPGLELVQLPLAEANKKGCAEDGTESGDYTHLPPVAEVVSTQAETGSGCDNPSNSSLPGIPAVTESSPSHHNPPSPLQVVDTRAKLLTPECLQEIREFWEMAAGDTSLEAEIREMYSPEVVEIALQEDISQLSLPEG